MRVFLLPMVVNGMLYFVHATLLVVPECSMLCIDSSGLLL